MATMGEKELRTSWDEQTANDSTKFIGHKLRLEPTEGSNVDERGIHGS